MKLPQRYWKRRVDTEPPMNEGDILYGDCLWGMGRRENVYVFVRRGNDSYGYFRRYSPTSKTEDVVGIPYAALEMPRDLSLDERIVRRFIWLVDSLWQYDWVTWLFGWRRIDRLRCSLMNQYIHHEYRS